jgi:hypothetical protein
MWAKVKNVFQTRLIMSVMEKPLFPYGITPAAIVAAREGREIYVGEERTTVLWNAFSEGGGWGRILQKDSVRPAEMLVVDHFLTPVVAA